MMDNVNLRMHRTLPYCEKLLFFLRIINKIQRISISNSLLQLNKASATDLQVTSLKNVDALTIFSLLRILKMYFMVKYCTILNIKTVIIFQIECPFVDIDITRCPILL